MLWLVGVFFQTPAQQARSKRRLYSSALLPRPMRHPMPVCVMGARCSSASMVLLLHEPAKPGRLLALQLPCRALGRFCPLEQSRARRGQAERAVFESGKAPGKQGHLSQLPGPHPYAWVLRDDCLGAAARFLSGQRRWHRPVFQAPGSRCFQPLRPIGTGPWVECRRPTRCTPFAPSWAPCSQAGFRHCKRAAGRVFCWVFFFFLLRSFIPRAV